MDKPIGQVTLRFIHAKRKTELERRSHSTGKIRPFPTPLMGAFIREMQERLKEKKIGYKIEFLREIIKEVRVRGREITLKIRTCCYI